MKGSYVKLYMKINIVHFIKVVRKPLSITLQILLVILLIFCCFLYSFSKWQFPNMVSSKIVPKQRIKEQSGLTIDYRKIQYNPLSGIDIHELKITAANFPRIVLLESEKVSVDMTHFKTFEKISMYNVRLQLPLDDAGKQSLRISKATIELTNFMDYYHVKIDGKVYKSIDLHIDFNIDKVDKADEDILQLKDIVARIRPHYKGLIANLEDFDKHITPKSQASLSITGKYSERRSLDAMLNVEISNVLYNGIFINRISVLCELDKEKVRAHKIRLDMEDDEFIQFEGEFNRLSRELKGRISSQVYPGKMIKVLQTAGYYKVNQDILKEIQFNSSPPNIQLTINPMTIRSVKDFQKGDYSYKIKLADSGIRNLHFNRAELSGTFKNNIVTFNNFEGELSPNCTFKIAGEYLINKRTLTLQGNYTGDPGRLSGMYKTGDPYKARYMKTWQNCEFFDSARPQIDFSMFMQIDEDYKKTSTLHKHNNILLSLSLSRFELIPLS